MSYLLSSVDFVLYCDTNGLTHAPTVLSLAPLNDSVLACSLGSLQIVHFLVLLRCTPQLALFRIINSSALLHSS